MARTLIARRLVGMPDNVSGGRLVVPMRCLTIHGPRATDRANGRSVAYHRTVFLYFDESGDYAFPADSFDCYVQAVLMCPDSRLPVLDRFVRERKAEWEVGELHATELEADQLVAICRFIESSACELLVSLTDTTITNHEGIATFRLGQAAKMQAGLNRYREQGGTGEWVDDWTGRYMKQAAYETKLTNGEFVQAHFMAELIWKVLQKVVYWYHEDRWRNDFHAFRFILDAKLPAKMAAGEKYLTDTIVPALASRPGANLDLIDTWRGQHPAHPFVAKFDRPRGRIRGREVEGVIDLKAIFERGLEFEPSHEHAGLQLVDCAAYVVRAAVLRPDDAVIQRAFDAIRPRLRNEQGKSLTINRLRGTHSDRSSLQRYRPLFGARRVP